MLAVAFRTYAVCAAILLGVWLYGRFGQGYWTVPHFASWREPSLLGLSAYLLGICAWLARKAWPDRDVALSPWVCAGAVLLVCWGAQILVLQGIQPSRDEQMAVFDAAIFRTGHLFAPLQPQWWPDAEALNREFMLPLGQPVAWVSSYLPMNAALRSLFSLAGLGALTGPALAAGSVALTWSIARTLWPEDRPAAAVAAVMLAGSGQFILTGMTAYAMTAHLFCNLAWLRLFLVRKGWADALAVAAGFAATGLHQPLFHPLFVAPLIALLAWRREWPRLALFTGSYAAIGAFWYLWPQWLAARIAASVPGGFNAGETASYADRLRGLIHVDLSNIVLQAYNAAGFAAWQHVLLVPLAVLGLRYARGNALLAALTAGFVLPWIALAVILPDQGFGYGYRYAHGVLGNAALLAAAAWHHLGPGRQRWRPLLVWTSIASMAALVPFQMWSAYSSFRPFAAADKAIAGSRADLFVLDAGWGRHVENLAYNPPYLDRRPIVLLADRIADPAGLARRHCRAGTTVGFGTQAFYTGDFGAFLPRGASGGDIRIAGLARQFAAAGCTVRAVD